VTSAAPARASASRCRRPTSRGGSVGLSPRRTTAETRKLSALTAKAHSGPTVTTRPPATGASTTWYSTAAVQIPELAATSSSSRTRLGSTGPAAGLKKTAAAENPKATAYTAPGWSCQTASTPASTARVRSEATMTRMRGSRSTRTPASGAISRTGRISATTTPATPRPEPVSW
jgi:hypothetical protein